jgi:hypothetical protein
MKAGTPIHSGDVSGVADDCPELLRLVGSQDVALTESRGCALGYRVPNCVGPAGLAGRAMLPGRSSRRAQRRGA